MKKIAIAIAFFSVFCMISAQKTEIVQQKSYSGPEIQFDKLANDYGELKVGDVKVGVFTFKNIGKQPLILDDVISSCDCTTLEWSKAPVMPGKTATIKATYTAKNSGLISKQITVLSNAESDRVVLRLKGKVK